MEKTKKIKHCKQSTISEAWAVVQGIPIPEVDSNEIGANVHSIQKEYPDSKIVPAIVVVQGDGKGPIAPFWQNQISIDSGNHLVRIGHQYLSIHFVRNNAKKYDTFSASFEPVAKKVTDIWAGNFSNDRKRMPLSVLGFGYINSFDFSRNNFDLSQYFQFNFGLNVSGINLALAGLKTFFNLVEQESKALVTLEVEVVDSPLGPDSVRLVTRVLAQSPNSQKILIGDKAAILSEMKRMKEIAKSTFFGFATQTTHQLMEAVYD